MRTSSIVKVIPILYVDRLLEDDLDGATLDLNHAFGVVDHQRANG